LCTFSQRFAFIVIIYTKKIYKDGMLAVRTGTLFSPATEFLLSLMPEKSSCFKGMPEKVSFPGPATAWKDKIR
jgi:hypothetical protein